MSSSCWATPARLESGSTIEVTTFAPASSLGDSPAMPSTSRLAGIRRSGYMSLMTAMARISSVSFPGSRTDIGVPSWGTNAMARTWSQPVDPMAIRERARSSALSPMPTMIPSSASSPTSWAHDFWSLRHSKSWDVRTLPNRARSYVSW